MNHKRHKPKNARGGCLMCKPHKANGYSRFKAAKPRDKRQLQITPVSFEEERGHIEFVDNPRVELLDDPLDDYDDGYRVFPDDFLDEDREIDPEAEELLVIDFFRVLGGGKSRYFDKR